MIRDKYLEVMPANVYVDPVQNGVRVGDVIEIVQTLYMNEIKGRWPAEVASIFISFQPIGALARVGCVQNTNAHTAAATQPHSHTQWRVLSAPVLALANVIPT